MSFFYCLQQSIAKILKFVKKQFSILNGITNKVDIFNRYIIAFRKSIILFTAYLFLTFITDSFKY